MYSISPLDFSRIIVAGTRAALSALALVVDQLQHSQKGPRAAPVPRHPVPWFLSRHPAHLELLPRRQAGFPAAQAPRFAAARPLSSSRHLAEQNLIYRRQFGLRAAQLLQLAALPALMKYPAGIE